MKEGQASLDATNVAISLLVVIFLSVVFFFGLQRIDTYLKSKAVDKCLKISQYEKAFPKDNVRVRYPVKEVYKDCLKEKGYAR